VERHGVASLFTSTPVGFDEPGMCSAQMCRITTPAITKGSRKCSEKKRLSAALSGAKPPSSQTWIGSPTSGIAPKQAGDHLAPQKLIWPHGST
jgi:hypothetical protein